MDGRGGGAGGQGMVLTIEPGCYFVPPLLEPAFAHPAQGPLLDEARLRPLYTPTRPAPPNPPTLSLSPKLSHARPPRLPLLTHGPRRTHERSLAMECLSLSFTLSPSLFSHLPISLPLSDSLHSLRCVRQ